MLSRLLRWIGLGAARKPKTAPQRNKRPRSATAHLFDKRAAPGNGKSPSAASAEGDFNPYNTGKFDRSASWERISKTQR